MIDNYFVFWISFNVSQELLFSLDFEDHLTVDILYIEIFAGYE